MAAPRAAPPLAYPAGGGGQQQLQPAPASNDSSTWGGRRLTTAFSFAAPSPHHPQLGGALAGNVNVASASAAAQPYSPLGATSPQALALAATLHSAQKQRVRFALCGVLLISTGSACWAALASLPSI